MFSFLFSSPQCKGLPRSTSHVQIRQHPDISIPCPANITTNGRYAGQHENGQQVSTVQSSVCTKISQSQSPKITLTSHPSAEDKTITEDDGHVLVSIDTDEQQTAPKQNPRFDSLTKKQLTRSMAIDRADSSGGKYRTYQPRSQGLSSSRPLRTRLRMTIL